MFGASIVKKWNPQSAQYEDYIIDQRSFSTIPGNIAQQLSNIPAISYHGITYYPCSVGLRNGELIDCVYIVDAQAYITNWGDWPNKEVSITDVKDIKESPFRLPSHLAQKLYDAGESGMGYVVFELLYYDGSQSSHVAGNAVDFVNLAPGKSMSQVKDIIPHKGRGKSKQLQQPEYFWCLYSK